MDNFRGPEVVRFYVTLVCFLLFIVYSDDILEIPNVYHGSLTTKEINGLVFWRYGRFLHTRANLTENYSLTCIPNHIRHQTQVGDHTPPLAGIEKKYMDTLIKKQMDTSMDYFM